MSIVHRNHRFIFLKSRKTAGTSLELHFIKNTVLGTDVWATSRDGRHYGVAQRKRHCVLRVGARRFFLTVPGAGRIGNGRSLIKQHQGAEELRRVLGEGLWSSSRKAVGVRNPWDNLLSYWRWSVRGREGRSSSTATPFEDWAWAALSGDRKAIKSAGSIDINKLLLDFVFDGDEPVADVLLYFERLNDSLRQLAEILDVPIPELSMRTKASERPDYRPYYTDSLAEAVGRKYERYLRLTGYSFDAPQKFGTA